MSRKKCCRRKNQQTASLIGEPTINTPKASGRRESLRSVSWTNHFGERTRLVHDSIELCDGRNHRDSHILMKDNFDLSNAEDQSEYGHELVHVAKSGGIAGAKITMRKKTGSICGIHGFSPSRWWKKRCTSNQHRRSLSTSRQSLETKHHRRRDEWHRCHSL